MINISFDFDPNSYEVTNIKVTSKDQSGLDKVISQMKEVIPESSKPKTTRKRKEKNEDIIKLEDNKIVLTQKLLNIIKAEPGDRISVQYKEFNGVYNPIIAKSEVFADPEAGNKLTKSMTVSYRGKQRDELAIYGEEFTFEETFEGSEICKLIGSNEIKADNKVFKKNKDLEPYDEIDNSSVQKKTPTKGGVDGMNFTYTPDLPTSKSRANSGINIEQFGFGVDKKPLDLSDFDDIDL